MLFRSTVTIVENDCHTNLGARIDLDFSQVGSWDLALDRRLTRADIEFFLGLGNYYRFIRNPPHCISPGGICRKCHQAVNTVGVSPEVGHQVTLSSSLIVATQSLTLGAGETSFILNTGGAEVTRVDVYFNDSYSSAYTLSFLDSGDLRLDITNTVVTGDALFVRMFQDTYSPYMSYLASKIGRAHV